MRPLRPDASPGGFRSSMLCRMLSPDQKYRHNVLTSNEILSNKAFELEVGCAALFSKTAL